MQRSSILEKSVRPKIFQEWPNRQSGGNFMIDEQVKHRAKPHQSLRAEEALQKSLFFLRNIQTFLEELRMSKEEFKYFEDGVAECQLKLEELSQQRGVEFNQREYILELKKYFMKIRQGSMILRKIRALGLANLQNYNKNTTKMDSTRTKQQAIRDLEYKIADFKLKRRKVQQSLVKYEYQIPSSIILGEQNTFQTFLQELIKSMQPDNVAQFHFLILYQLQQLQQITILLQNKLVASNQNYSRYQGLNDSLNLMQKQTDQMRNDRKHLKKIFLNLNIDNAQQLIPKASNSLPLLQKNVQVYQSNLSLFARYNAQTNLKQFSKRRQKYTDEYGKFKSLFENWRVQQKHAQYIFARHQMLIDAKKKVQITHKKSVMEWEYKKMQKAYLEVLEHQLPPKMPSIQRYKMNVADQFQTMFKKQKIAFPKRQRAPIQKQGQKQYLTKTNKLQPFVNFFVNLRHKQYNQKLQYLIDKEEQVNSLQYRITHQFKRKNFQQQKYQIGLKYSQAIISYLKNKITQQEYLSKVQSLSLKRWQALPIGLQLIVFNFTKDVITTKQALQYLVRTQQKKIQKYESIMMEQITWKKDWSNYYQTSEIPFSANQSDAQGRRQFFINYVHKISKYSPMLRNKLIESLFEKYQSVVQKCYAHVSLQISPLNKIDKQKFFTFKILCYLAEQDRRVKIPNLREHINYYLKYVDIYEERRWTSKHFFAQIIKQRILLKYFKKHLSKYTNITPQIKCIEKLNRFCIFRYQINDHLEFSKTDDLETHVIHSLSIYRAMRDEDKGYQVIGDANLAETTQKICKNFEESPLVFSRILEIDIYDNLINFSKATENLERLSKININKRIQFLSDIYVNAQSIKDTRDTLNSIQLDSSDIIAIKQSQKRMIYLEQQSEQAQSILKPEYMKQLIIVQNMYRGQISEKPPKDRPTYLNKIAQKLKSISTIM